MRIFCHKEIHLRAFSYSASNPSPRLFTHVIISFLVALLPNRLPESHWAPSVRLCKCAALEPMPLLPEVQNGIIVFPEKS